MVEFLTEPSKTLQWYSFWDMNSGRGRKTEFDKIFIEALSKRDAVAIFEGRFHRDPSNVTCECCGPDFSIDEYESLARATAYHRNCDYVDGKYVEQAGPYGKYLTVDQYASLQKVLVLRNVVK